MIAAESRDGGFSVSTHEDPFDPVGFLHYRENYRDIEPDKDERFRIEYEKADIHYRTLILAVLFFTTVWLAWRWRRTMNYNTTI